MNSVNERTLEVVTKNAAMLEAISNDINPSLLVVRQCAMELKREAMLLMHEYEAANRPAPEAVEVQK